MMPVVDQSQETFRETEPPGRTSHWPSEALALE
jgi:hypothetical protein